LRITPSILSLLALRQLLLCECADHDVVAVWISERKLSCPGGRVHMRFLVESGYKFASSL